MTLPLKPEHRHDLPPPLTLPAGSKDPAACVAWLRERYMKNSRDQYFDDVIREILETDEAGNLTARPQRNGLVNETRGALVLGQPRSGKTALIHRNFRHHPAITVTEGGALGNALYFRVSASPTLKGIATDILKKTGYAKVHNGLRSSQVWDLVVARLASLGITILWLDEAHHMLELQKERTDVLRRFKTLLQGDNAIALVVSGIPSLADKVQEDEETNERFSAFSWDLFRQNGKSKNCELSLRPAAKKFNSHCQPMPILLSALFMGQMGASGALWSALTRQSGVPCAERMDF